MRYIMYMSRTSTISNQGVLRQAESGSADGDDRRDDGECPQGECGRLLLSSSKDIAKLHTETVNKYKPSCSGFVCDNAKLRNYIASKTDAASAKEYQQNVEQIRDAEAAKNSSDKGMVMKKETLNEDAQKTTTVVSGIVVGVIVIVAFVMLAILIRRRRKNMVE